MSEVGGPRPVPKTGTILGEIAKPPFAVLPDPATLFLGRAKRLAELAPGHQLEPYLRFLAEVARAQHDIASAADLLPALLPDADRIAQALEHGMPPVPRSMSEHDGGAMDAIGRLINRLTDVALPAETAAAIAGLRAASPDERRRKAHEALLDMEPADDLA